MSKEHSELNLRGYLLGKFEGGVAFFDDMCRIMCRSAREVETCRRIFISIRICWSRQND